MFISDTHLPHVLTPEQYGSEQQLHVEREQLFDSRWHCVGQWSEFSNEGSFKTTELLGRPLILWRQDDAVHAFLNVCPHRHSMLTEAGCGNMIPLRCQYHGWEFDQTGNTRKIPDARSFKPLQPGVLCLTRFPTHRIGQLIFVSLAADPVEWPDALGPKRHLFEQWFTEDRIPVLTTDELVPANWKIVMENAIEGYHVEMVHSKTFGRMAEAARCGHELGDDWSWYQEQMPLKNFDRRMHRWLGLDVDELYQIYHVFPNLLIGKMAFFQWMFTVLPIAPRKTRLLTYLFCQGGVPGRIDQKLAARLVVQWGRRFFRRVMEEDLRIMPALQKGLDAPVHASEGLISVREERLFQFQKYIQRRGSPVELQHG